MEIFFGACYYALVFLLASFGDFRPRGWALAWAGFLGFAGFNLLLVKIFGGSGATFSRVFLVALVIALLALIWKRGSFKRFRPKSYASAALTFAVIAFVAIRNFFPQYDVDSLNYHIPGVLWHILKEQLTPFQQHIEAVSLWFVLIGTEEFLLVPGFSSKIDLALFGGVVGGLFKNLCLLTVISMLPARAFLARTIVFVLMLIDEHFFFSGISRYVYISPAMIGLSALLAWFLWRGVRFHFSSLWLALSMALLLTSVKYHGQFFFVGTVLAIGGIFVWRVWNRRSIAFALPSGIEAITFLLSAFSTGAIHLQRLLATGSPIPPYSVGPFRADALLRGSERLQDITFEGSLLSVLQQPVYAMKFHGMYASIFVLLLILPTFGARILIPYLPFLKRIFSRSLGFALFGFLFTAVWNITAVYIRPDESRYPRYALAVASISLAFWALSFHHRIRIWLKRFLPISLPLYDSKALPLALSIAILTFIAVKTDSRYRNVGIDERPNFTQIVEFISYYVKNPAPFLQPKAAYMRQVMLPLNHISVPQMQECVLSLAREKSDPSLLLGNKMAVYGPNAVWPSYLVAPMAAIGTISEGGGYFRLPKESPSLRQNGIQYAMIPRSKSLWPRDPSNPETPNSESERGSTKEIVFDSLVRAKINPVPLCESPEMLLVELTE